MSQVTGAYPDPATLAVLLQGDLLGGAPTAPIRGVAIDSRRVQPGDVFFALPGRHADGHTYLAAALEAGAVLVVSRCGRPLPEGPALVVDDPLVALQQLAGWYRRRHIRQVVAITGSNGKTIVKDALTAAVASRFRVAASPGSWNSQVGVPLAVLQAPPGTELGVFEAGVSAPGEMAQLAGILQPDVGILVNVGLAHLASFGSRENTAREKLLLFQGMPPPRWVLLPDDPLLRAFTLPCPVLHPQAEGPRLLAQTPTPNGLLLTLAFAGEAVSLQISVRTRSRPLVDDLLLAITAAVRLGVEPEAIAQALHDYSFGPTRMETWRTPEGVTIVNDTASSDPLSVQAALDGVAASPEATGRRIFLFGGMAELGEREALEHRLIGRVAAERGFTHLVLLPHPAQAATAAGWRAAAPEAPLLEVADPLTLRRQLRELARRGDLLLVKGPSASGLAAMACDLWESMAPRRFVVDVGAIRENIARFRALCGPDVAILAVLKAWAYGTELARLAAALQEGGVDWIGVSAADEGAIVRRAGVHLPILVLLMDSDEVDKAVRHRLTPVVYSHAFALALIESLRAMQATLEVHLEIETGMGRLGVAPEEALAVARLLRSSGVVRLTGVMTHLASADDPAADGATRCQLEVFEAVVADLRAEADEPLIVHASATSGAVRFPEARYGMVRLGLGLYGLAPSPAVGEGLDLQLAVAFVSRLAQVSTLRKGQRVGYNGTYVVDTDAQRVGIVAAGYNDGVPWTLSNTGQVMVQGQRVPVIGRVSMDSMAIDLSTVPQATVGDEVLLFGAHEGHTLRPEEVAAAAGTIPYDLLVHVDSRRVQRLFRSE
ncbi:MAG: alanine racemase [Cyanobacteriota bacterium]|nr:alanine racemase [Cyanobacteriota bacterium]